MIKAVIFDLDGVLVDSIPAHISVWQELVKPYGIDFNLEKAKRFNGMSTREIARNLLGEIASDEQLAEFIRKKQEVSTKKLIKEFRFFEGAKEVLTELKEKGFRLALASSNRMETLNAFISRGKMKGLFDAIVSGNEMPNSKPSPEIFLTAAQRLGVKPKECIVVEDSLNGVTAAKRAGMKCFAVRNDFAPSRVFEMADEVIDSVKEIDANKL